MKSDQKTIVVALGGNAILKEGERGTYLEQYNNVAAAVKHIIDMIEEGYKVVITHGNGPQVGNLLVQAANSADEIAPMPLFCLGAMTQGQIGFMIEQALAKYLTEKGLEQKSAVLVTQTLVEEDDPAIQNPTKPIGPYYDEARAKQLQEEGMHLAEEAGHGWRQVVGSPVPKKITNIKAIKDLVEQNAVVVCAGGGGVPVVDRGNKDYYGIDVVIDKDRAAAELAAELNADILLILTAVPKVYLDFGGPNERALDRVGVSEMEKFYKEGHFAAGSMGPKVEACIAFAKQGGLAIIGELKDSLAALKGETGTHIVPD